MVNLSAQPDTPNNNSHTTVEHDRQTNTFPIEGPLSHRLTGPGMEDLGGITGRSAHNEHTAQETAITRRGTPQPSTRSTPIVSGREDASAPHTAWRKNQPTSGHTHEGVTLGSPHQSPRSTQRPPTHREEENEPTSHNSPQRSPPAMYRTRGDPLAEGEFTPNTPDSLGDRPQPPAMPHLTQDRINTPEGWAADHQNSPATADQRESISPSQTVPSQSPSVRSMDDMIPLPARTSSKKTKAYLTIATENIRGRGALTIRGSLKWRKLADDIRAQKIGAIALQETHMSNEHVTQAETMYRNLKIFNSALPANPTGAGGVAIVLNKLLTNTQTAKQVTLVEGRAIAVEFEWHRGKRLCILAVYAPTNKHENKSFWKLIKRRLREPRFNLARPEILLGDMNCVEDPVDRFPAKLTPIDNPESLRTLKKALRVTDVWRETFPDTVEWTWRNPTRSSMSRLDRIYLSRALSSSTREWQTQISGLTSNDHSRVSVQIAHLDAPDIGPGRWTMQASAIRDTRLMSMIDEMGRTALEQMKAASSQNRTDKNNPQLIWKDLKSRIAKCAKARARELNCARQSKTKTAEKTRTDILAMLTSSEQGEQHDQLTKDLRKAEENLEALRERDFNSRFARRSANNWMAAEMMSRDWFRWHKDPTPRDTIAALKRPGAATQDHSTNSKQMAALARDYHESIQLLDLEVDAEERTAATEEALRHILTPATPRIAEELGRRITRQDVEESLGTAKNNSAAGLDGLIYELWKELKRKHAAAKKRNQPAFDVVGAMLLVFEDLETFGVDHSSDFTDGWLCPLYKKGDRDDISNYRPITLLNSDYKTYTKALALRLARAAPEIIHKSQAGFVRGRSITDQTKLTTLVIDYAEATETDGAIVALDQEKAYDRIRHDYLLTILRGYNFPERLVRTIESLYKNARTAVIVNGCISTKYTVTRGVRQGDPLSCLLFNLAIEPLSAMLRNSTLHGISVNGLTEKLVASLYADDTTVFLSAADSYETLRSMLRTWCLASGAKFNIKKTEIIPLGSPEYRARLIQSRRLNETDIELPAQARIARDGEPTRILGAWPGNAVGVVNAWSTILDKLDDKLARWSRARPSLNGRSMVSRVIIGGHTQFLTAAQGMPQSIERRLDKTTLNFFWGNMKRHPINATTLRLPRSEGGMNLFHAEERNEAQYLSWISAFMAPEPLRPAWAVVAERIFETAMILDQKARIPPDQRANPFYQDWRPNLNKLPFVLRQMVRTARKYGVTVDAPVIPLEIRERVQVWSHPAFLDGNILHNKRGQLKCLRTNHAVATVEDLEELAELDCPDHTGRRTCPCENCATDRAEGCRNPARCQDLASDVLSSIAEKWNTATADCLPDIDTWSRLLPSRNRAIESGTPIAFDPITTTASRPEDLSRVFTDSIAIRKREVKDRLRSEAGVRELAPTSKPHVEVNICAALVRADTDDAKSGFSVHFPGGEYEDLHHCCAGPIQSYVHATATAICATLLRVDKTTRVHITVPCRLVVDALTISRRKNEDTGWQNLHGDGPAMRAAIAALRSRSAATTFTHVAKKAIREDNETKDNLQRAATAALWGTPYQLDQYSFTAFDLPGLSLQKMTQKTAHRAIKTAKLSAYQPRRATVGIMNRVKEDIRQACDSAPTSKQLWDGVQSRDLSTGARVFLWKGLHDAHKVGTYFSKMPEPWKSRENCPTCHVTESMEHILLECPETGQETIWKLVTLFLKKKQISIRPSIGTIWGCASTRPEGTWRQRTEGLARAFRIVVAESAFLIWKLRCLRRIEHGDDPERHWSPEQVQKKWKSMLKSRVLLDSRLTNRGRYGNNALDPGLRWSTWRNNTAYEPYLIERKKSNPGVLVGIGEQVADGVS